MFQHERIWNALVPACALQAEVIDGIGVRYLHPTKGFRTIGWKRFYIRGAN
jgi:hypothetical protein